MSRSTRISQLSSLSRRLVGTAVEKLLGSILVYCFCGGHIHIALFVNGPAKHRSTQLWLVQSVFFSFLFFCGEKGGIRKKKGKSRKDINNLSSKKKNFFFNYSFLPIFNVFFENKTIRNCNSSIVFLQLLLLLPLLLVIPTRLYLLPNYSTLNCKHKYLAQPLKICLLDVTKDYWIQYLGNSKPDKKEKKKKSEEEKPIYYSCFARPSSLSKKF